MTKQDSLIEVMTMLRATFVPAHGQNRMKFEGDVARARNYFFTTAPANLRFLLANRYEWMNAHISPTGKGIEVGCGSGLSKLFIQTKDYKLTDFADHPWIDVPNVDALATPFPNDEFDFVVSSNMIHHVPYPLRFFAEMNRILKPGGALLIQELNASLAMRFLLRVMRHEGYSYEPDVFDPDLICTDPEDLWSANCAIPNLLFDDPARFRAELPYFRMTYHRFREFTCFINSGGVIAKTACVRVPRFALRAMKLFDDVLTWALPGVFALQRQIVLKKVGNANASARRTA